MQFFQTIFSQATSLCKTEIPSDDPLYTLIFNIWVMGCQLYKTPNLAYFLEFNLGKSSNCRLGSAIWKGIASRKLLCLNA